jgi:hypothetical protein
MSTLRRSGRFALVGALAVSLSTILMPITAGAVSTGTVTAITNGVTVTYSSPNTGSDEVFVMIYASPHTCAASDNPGTATYFLMSENAGPSYIRLGASPRTLEFGSTVGVNAGSAQGSIAAGNWEVCLVWNDNGSFSVLSSAAMTAVDPTPPTTATTVAPTTTSSTTSGAAADPVTPAFTG